MTLLAQFRILVTIFIMSSCKSRGGGVEILCRNNLKPVKINCGNYSSFEHCALYICCSKNTVRFNFIVLYRLLDIPIKQFLSDLACLLETISTFPGIVIVGGDVNLHLDKLLDNNTINFKNLIKSFNFSQMVSDPTHKKGHLLDVVLTNDCTSVSNMKVVNLDIDDHSLIRFDIPMHPEIIKPYKSIQMRDFRSIDHDDFLLDLYTQFCVSDVPTTLETAIDQYNISIQTLIDKHAPAKLKRIKNVSSCPWFDQEYLLLRRKRRKAESFIADSFQMVKPHVKNLHIFRSLHTQVRPKSFHSKIRSRPKDIEYCFCC